MRIFLSLNNNWNSNVWASRFIDACPEHDFKIAAYYRNHDALNHFDWCLNALKTFNYRSKKKVNQLFGNKDAPLVDFEKISFILDSLILWEPDLVISEVEPISVYIASVLNIELWYCSPLLLLTGIVWPKNSFVPLKYLQSLKDQLQTLPPAKKSLIYSPIDDIVGGLPLKQGYVWARPYVTKTDIYCSNKEVKNSYGYKHVNQLISNSYRLISGETSYLADSLYLKKTPIIIADPKDPEQATNARLAEVYDFGINASGIEYKNSLANNLLQNISEKTISLKDQLNKQLHEYLY